jgi:predicted DNA-binding antitoxin AbrB/MazE fold protein
MKKEIRKIELSNGEILEVDIHEGFYDVLRKKLILNKNENITDEQIKRFIIHSLNSYLDKSHEAA